MNYEGIDTAARWTAEHAKILLSDGVTFGVRFLVPAN